jgi:hypothetical protein
MGGFQMYIVVRHRDDPNQTYTNSWIDADLLQAITTPRNVADLLKIEKANARRVYVHRCGFVAERPKISCPVEVDKIENLIGPEFLAYFPNPIRHNGIPPVNPMEGQNYY